FRVRARRRARRRQGDRDHHGARPLSAFDPDLVDLLVARSRALGINVTLGAAVTRIDKAGPVFTVHAEAQGTTLQMEAVMVMHGAGRVPEIDDRLRWWAWAHFEFTRINITPTILPKKFED